MKTSCCIDEVSFLLKYLCVKAFVDSTVFMLPQVEAALFMRSFSCLLWINIRPQFSASLLYFTKIGYSPVSSQEVEVHQWWLEAGKKEQDEMLHSLSPVHGAEVRAWIFLLLSNKRHVRRIHLIHAIMLVIGLLC